MRDETMKKAAVVIGQVAAERIFKKRAAAAAGPGARPDSTITVSRTDLAAMIAVGALNAWKTDPEDVYDERTGLKVGDEE